MTDKIHKFLDKLEPKQAKRLDSVIDSIRRNQLHGLDVKPITGRKSWFRCRIGKIRIVFIRTSAGHNIIYEISFRGQAYRNL